MSNVSGGATVWNCPNYVGELFLLGQNQTPFLNIIGGLSGGGKIVGSWEFPVDQTYSLESASQPSITETASKTAPTATTYVRAQDTNVCQIFQKAVDITYAKSSNPNTISGLSVTGENQPVQSELDFQITAALAQMAIDLEYTFINGVYAKAANAGQPNKTRGMLAAITTNVIANTPDTLLTKDMINAELRSMATNGAPFGNMLILANAFNIDRITDIYAYAPTDRTIGGTAIKQILTNFCTLGVVYCPQMPVGEVMIVDASVVNPVFLPVPANAQNNGQRQYKGTLFYEPLAKTGAADTGQLYGQIGLAHGVERYHGKITGLASS